MSERESNCAVGNDVVDFAEARWEPSKAVRAFTRFTERVCTIHERELVAAARRPECMLWALFAAKEAAYKVISRLTPGVVFAHQAFEVSSSLTEVRHGSTRMQLQIRMRPGHVHATAWTGQVEPFYQVAVLARGDSASAAVRRLASTMLACRLGCAPDHVRIVREPHAAYWDGLGPPFAQVRGERAPFCVSLSHHGRFVSCCALRLYRGCHSRTPARTGAP
jgi:phosphopantetheinyl transferase (holo-ACP synthase)